MHDNDLEAVTPRMLRRTSEQVEVDLRQKGSMKSIPTYQINTGHGHLQ